MSKITIHNQPNVLLDPNTYPLEVVERKFRGHPDSLAEMVAERFAQLYIENSWNKFPALRNKAFPNFSADKVTLVGASTQIKNGQYKLLKPVHALLIGKITRHIGNVNLNIENLFRIAVNDVFNFALGNYNFKNKIVYETYAITLAGVDHNSSFYNPISAADLLRVLKSETVANDTVYVVAYAPLSIAEKLSIKIENITIDNHFITKFPTIGTDIKCLIRRRSNNFEITLCLPIDPEKVSDNKIYSHTLKQASKYIKKEIVSYLKQNKIDNPKIKLWVNTKDTPRSKYYAVWGTALSKGDIGAVGRGNRRQGFISGVRPSTNEAVAGKNPNHFAGIIYQMIAEEIAISVYKKLHLANTVYITSNNGDFLGKPNSVDVILDNTNLDDQRIIRSIVNEQLKSINQIRTDYINSNIFDRFMKPAGANLK